MRREWWRDSRENNREKDKGGEEMTEEWRGGEGAGGGGEG